jgi:hypothetical protein
MLGQVPSDEIGVLFFALRNLHYLKVMNMLIFLWKKFKSIDVNFHVANWNSFIYIVSRREFITIVGMHVPHTRVFESILG